MMKKRPEDQTVDEWLADYDRLDVPAKSSEDEKPRFSIVTKEECSLQDDLPLIKPGRYTARYFHHELRKGMFEEGSCRLGIKFETYGNGIPILVQLEAWFPVNATKNGFSASKRSKYARQFFSVFPDLTGQRMDRLSPKKLKGIELEVEVATVCEDSEHNPIPKALQYSKIKRIIGRKK